MQARGQKRSAQAAARYHSLVFDTTWDDLITTVWNQEGIIMGGT